MARLRRLSAPGHTHHVIQRGNNRQTVFVDDQDRQRYLRDLSEALKLHPVALHAYVLMPNHVHLLATPQEEGALSRLMQHLGRQYVRYFNARHGRTGTLWEGRYRSALIDSERYLMACSLYIDNNPVKAQIAVAAADFPWSSAQHHVGLRVDPVVTDHPLYWALGNTPFEREATYRRLLDEGVAAATADAIRAATLKGWALGDEPFVEEVEEQTERRARPLPRGRPVRRSNV